MHVFVGPTLPGREPALDAPGVRVWPPARHGDLFETAIRPGDTVVLIDGLYHQAPALRHKEILAALSRGVRVIGAASIGALRAAELAPFGMAGIGRVYRAYARGDLVGDDEVAVGQAPDGAFEALTWPLVNLRHVLELALAAGVLDAGRAAGLLAGWRAVYYPQRTSAAVRAVCRRLGETQFAGWLAAQRERNPHFGDVKRADALAAVRAALDGAVLPAASRPPAVERSTYFRRWSNAFARRTVDGLELSTQDRLLYQQVFNPAFPERWAAHLDHCSRHPDGGEPGLPLAERLSQVAGGSVPAHRLFRPPVDLRDEATVALLLADETAEDRAAVARYADILALARRTRPGFCLAAVRDDLTRKALLDIWGCGEQGLDAEASARGLGCAARALQEAKRLMPGHLTELTEEKERSSAR